MRISMNSAGNRVPHNAFPKSNLCGALCFPNRCGCKLYGSCHRNLQVTIVLVRIHSCESVKPTENGLDLNNSMRNSDGTPFFRTGLVPA